MVGHLLQYHPAYLKLKSLVEAGEIGELRHVTSHRLNPGAIRTEGLKPQSRRQVHLSGDEETALRVGQRHGKPVIFQVAAGRMQAEGFSFYQADNGVWLTDAVPPQFLEAL